MTNLWMKIESFMMSRRSRARTTDRLRSLNETENWNCTVEMNCLIYRCACVLWTETLYKCWANVEVTISQNDSSRFKSIQVDSRSQAWSGNNKLQGWTVGDSPRASIKLVANLRKWGILSDLSWEELVPASFRSNRPVDRALFLRIRVRVTRRDSYSNLWKRLIVCLN